MKINGKVRRLAVSSLLLLGMTGFTGAEAAVQYPSQTLEVAPVKTEVKQVSGVVYEQVPSCGTTWRKKAMWWPALPTG